MQWQCNGDNLKTKDENSDFLKHKKTQKMPKSKLKLLVFCGLDVAYLVPDTVIKEAKRLDAFYESKECITEQQLKGVLALFDNIKASYKPIYIGHLLTGDIS